MVFLDVPINVNLPWQSYRVSLSGQIYTLELRYNGRMDRWICTIEDPQGNVILGGFALLIGLDLTGQYRYLSIPVGTFFCVDDTGGDNQPGQFDFGVQNSFVYADPTQ